MCDLIVIKIGEEVRNTKPKIRREYGFLLPKKSFTFDGKF